MPVAVLRSTDADVAVLVAPQVLTPTFKILYGMGHAALGQEVFFLGFPYMLSTEAPGDVNYGFPMPFIKRGTLSAWHKGQPKELS